MYIKFSRTCSFSLSMLKASRIPPTPKGARRRFEMQILSGRFRSPRPVVVKLCVPHNYFLIEHSRCAREREHFNLRQRLYTEKTQPEPLFSISLVAAPSPLFACRLYLNPLPPLILPSRSNYEPLYSRNLPPPLSLFLSLDSGECEVYGRLEKRDTAAAWFSPRFVVSSISRPQRVFANAYTYTRLFVFFVSSLSAVSLINANRRLSNERLRSAVDRAIRRNEQLFNCARSFKISS